MESADADIAEGVLEDDGTLLVIAHGAGETKLTVTATAGGEQAAATVSVKVRDARRTLILCIAGALIVVLLILLGRPVKKAPAKSEEAPTVAAEPEETTPTVIFVSEDEPNDNPERS